MELSVLLLRRRVCIRATLKQLEEGPLIVAIGLGHAIIGARNFSSCVVTRNTGVEKI